MQAVTFSESDSERSMVVASLGVADHSVGVACASEGDSEGSMAVGAAYSPDSLPELGLQDDGSTEGDVMIDIGGAEGQATTVLSDSDSDEGNGQAPSAKDATAKRRAPRRRIASRLAKRRNIGQAVTTTPADHFEDFLVWAFSWPQRWWSAASSVAGRDVVLRRAFRTITVSTFFSGLGTVELAAQMMQSWAPHTVGAPWDVRPQAACDKSRSCQKVLMSRGGGCVFKDILDFVPGAAELFREACRSPVDFQRLKEKILINSEFTARGRCAAHGSCCHLTTAYLDVSGSPCTPWSRAAGRRRRGRAHVAVTMLLAWIRVTRAQRPVILVHENVLAFDLDILKECLGDLYSIQVIKVEPRHAGFFFIRRPRSGR